MGQRVRGKTSEKMVYNELLLLEFISKSLYRLQELAEVLFLVARCVTVNVIVSLSYRIPLVTHLNNNHI